MTEPWPIKSWPTESLTGSAITRAARTKIREIEAHRRAISMHEDAVILFDKLHQTEKSARARERAAGAREMLRLALTEQEEMTSPDD
jgi:hypothetical protein